MKWTVPLLMYFAARLAEWSTVRGFLLLAGSALGLGVTEQDWDVVYQAYQILVGAGQDLADSDRVQVAVGSFLHMSGAAGLVGMLFPDKMRLVDRVKALFTKDQ